MRSGPVKKWTRTNHFRHGSFWSGTILEEPLMPPWPPLVTARRLEEQLEKSYIQRHREETLRLLEFGPIPHQASGSRVPNIIQRRIRRAAVMKDSWGLGTPRG